MHTKKASSDTVCSICSDCTFFNNPDLSPPELLLKKFYCLNSGCQHCVIYRRYTAGKTIPPGICPDGEVKISDIDSQP